MTRLLPYAAALALVVAFEKPAMTKQAVDQPRPVPPGKLVDVGGRKLHVYCTGDGSPTVVLKSGAGLLFD